MIVHEGLGFRLENFPHGTRVVYPPESIPAVPDVDEAIDHAHAAGRLGTVKVAFDPRSSA
jgi:hypothetical protein